jgi:outer membrane receptor protein involved in Fe transport
MKKNHLLTTVFFTLILVPAFAQDITKDTVAVQEVIITGSKLPQSPGNITQKIDIIDKAEIGKVVSGNRNVAEVIMYKPGVSASALSRNDANWGTYSGIGAKYSTYMLQGLPLDAFVDPMSIDLMAIDRIELQHGPASVLYPNFLSQDFAGTQSSLAGTVNLILKEKIDKPLTMVSTSYGSYNTLNGQFYSEGRINTLSYFAGISYENSDYTNYGTDPSWLNMHKDPEYRKSKFFGGLTWVPAGDDRHKLTLFVNKTLHYGDAGRVYRGFDNDYGTVNAGYSIDFTDRLILQAHMGLRQYDRKWQESNYGVVDTLKSNNGVVQNIIPADISLTFRHGNRNSLIVGSDYQGADYYNWSDPLNGYRSYGNKSSAFQAGFYAQEEVYISKLVWRGGLRYNYIRTNIFLVDGGAPGEDSQDWNRLLWSTGLRYNLDNGVSFYANAGNSFLTPGLKAMGGTISLSDYGVPGRNGQLPNPDLKPESGLGIDLGTEVSLPAGFRVSARGFYIVIDDAIIDNVVSEDPSQTQSVNAGETKSQGIEAEIRQSVSNHVQWFVNYTYIKSEVTGAGSVPFAPEQVANIGLNLSTSSGLKVNPYLNYNSGYYDSSDEASRNFFKPGALLNINASQVISGTEKFTVEFFGNFYNITNNKYEMPWQFRNPGFSMMAGLKATF